MMRCNDTLLLQHDGLITESAQWTNPCIRAGRNSINHYAASLELGFTLIEWWELPVQVWRRSNLSFYHLFANKTAFSHTLLQCALTPMLELILSLGTKDPGSIEYQGAMDPHLLLRLQSANQNPLNRLLTNQRYGWCKTGCRGKVVYNAGPGAGGDRQELAAAPGLGLPLLPSDNTESSGH